MRYDIYIRSKGKKIYKKLGWLNELPADEAEYVFYQCSGSEVWSRQMTSSRPYPMLLQLFDTACRFWTSLDAAEQNSACDHTTPDEKLDLILQNLSHLLER